MNAPGNALQPVVETALSLSIGDDAILGGSLKVHRVTGHEAISTPFRYEIELMREGGSLSSGEVLGKDATLEISVTDGGTTTPGDAMVRRVHGVVEEFLVEESAGDDGHAEHRYRVVLVPRLAALARNRQNRIHATSAHQTLEQIIRHKLRSSGPDYGRDETLKRVVLEDDEFRIDIDAGDVPVAQLSHVAQHNETDLDFIRRLCESHGVYFFFASNAGDADNAEDTRGMVVFGNTNTPFGVIRFEKDAPVQTMDPEGAGREPGGLGAIGGRLPRDPQARHRAGADGCDGTHRRVDPYAPDAGRGRPSRRAGRARGAEGRAVRVQVLSPPHARHLAGHGDGGQGGGPRAHGDAGRPPPWHPHRARHLHRLRHALLHAGGGRWIRRDPVAGAQGRQPLLHRLDQFAVRGAGAHLHEDAR